MLMWDVVTLARRVWWNASDSWLRSFSPHATWNRRLEPLAKGPGLWFLHIAYLENARQMEDSVSAPAAWFFCQPENMKGWRVLAWTSLNQGNQVGFMDCSGGSLARFSSCAWKLEFAICTSYFCALGMKAKAFFHGSDDSDDSLILSRHRI